MKFSLVLCVLFLFVATGISQERANVWYFGQHAGLTFADGNPEVINNGVMLAEAGCSCICDNQGRLQCYTNGLKVWNKNHQLMAEGDSLHGSQKLNQNSVIVPLPFSDSLYYLFTVIDADTMNHFMYSVIDMSLENGLGKLIHRNVFIAEDIVEKIAAIQHCNGRDYWILVHGNNNAFYAYLLTPNGLSSSPVESSVGTRPRASIGYLKISPAGNKLVMPINDETLLAEVFRFDNQSGFIDQPMKIVSEIENTYGYGFEFSSDGVFLYMSTGGRDYGLWQYDVSTHNDTQLNGSSVKIASGNNYAMQLASNGQIYIAAENRPWLNAIQYPNKKGSDCNYLEKNLLLNGDSSLMGLPNFVQSWFYKPNFVVEKACVFDTTNFTFLQPDNLDSIRWSFGDGTQSVVVYSPPYLAMHQYTSSAMYTVKAALFHCGRVFDVIKHVEIFPKPELSLVADTVIFPGGTLTLDAGGPFDSYSWSNGSFDQYLTVYTAGTYSVEVSNEGCTEAALTVVADVMRQVWAPTAFTPNSDGVNDEFKLIFNSSPTTYKLSIMNRIGTQVFQSTQLLQGWDGFYQGKPCETQTFVWFVEYSYFNVSGINYKGSKKGVVTLVR